MDKIRLGKDITFTGMLTVNGVEVNLSGLDLEAVATNKSDMQEYPCELTVSGNSFTIVLRGDQGDGPALTTGKYVISIWQNRGKDNQTVWDKQAFQLVQWTFKENDDEDGLDVQSVSLGTIEITDEVIQEAIKAAEAANTAATAANTAAAYANTVNEGVDQLKSELTIALSNANTAAQNANTAKDNLISSTDDIIQNVNEAISKIHTIDDNIETGMFSFVDGTLVEYGTIGSFSISNPIKLNEGDIITIPYGSSLYISDDYSVGKSLEIADIEENSYTATSDCYAFISNYTSTNYSIYLSKDIISTCLDVTEECRNEIVNAKSVLSNVIEANNESLSNAVEDVLQAKSEASEAVSAANNAAELALSAKDSAESAVEHANNVIEDLDVKLGNKTASGYSRQGFNYSGCYINGLNIGVGTKFYVKITNNSSKRFTLICNTNGDNSGSQSVQVVSMSGFFGITANRVINTMYLSLGGSYTSNESITLDVRYNLSGEIQEAVTNANSAAETARTRAASAESAAVLANRAADRFGQYDADALDQMVEDINTFKATGVYAEDLNEEDYVPQEWSAEDVVYSDSATYPEGTVGYKLKLLTESSASLEIGEDGYILID